MSCGKPCECRSLRDHYLSISVAATPSRTAVAEQTARETTLSKDLDAYKRMADSGLNPARIDGASSMESRSRWEIEAGRKLDERTASRVEEACLPF